MDSSASARRAELAGPPADWLGFDAADGTEAPVRQPQRCSDVARRRAEPRYASAPLVQQWLLLTHPGPWGRHILTEAGLEPGVAGALDHWAKQTSGRVQLIRRPGAAGEAETSRRWCWADSRPGRVQLRWGTVERESDILDVLPDPSAAGQPSAEPVYLVCVHGKHDMCCAVRGRPVAAALAAEYPQRTWECSHVGGHRLAANLVLLPHGLYHGQVAPMVASHIVRAYDHGRLFPQWLRGCSALSAPVQAAQHFARNSTGENGVDSYPPLSCAQTGPDEWAVQLAAPGGSSLTLLVRARMQRTDEPLSCADTAPGQWRRFELVSE